MPRSLVALLLLLPLTAQSQTWHDDPEAAFSEARTAAKPTLVYVMDSI